MSNTFTIDVRTAATAMMIINLSREMKIILPTANHRSNHYNATFAVDCDACNSEFLWRQGLPWIKHEDLCHSRNGCEKSFQLPEQRKCLGAERELSERMRESVEFVHMTRMKVSESK